jgi:hypothetical protein
MSQAYHSNAKINQLNFRTSPTHKNPSKPPSIDDARRENYPS